MIGSQRCDLFTNRTIFCSKSHLFLSQWEWDSKTKQPIRFQGFFKLNNHIAGKWKTKSHCLANLAIKLCNFKMDLIKWQLNFGSCNFGLKSHVWFQTKLLSTQFNYHYEVCINNDLVIHRRAKTSDIISRRFSDFMTPLSRVQMFQSSQEMHKQIRLSCQRDALHQTIKGRVSPPCACAAVLRSE